MDKKLVVVGMVVLLICIGLSGCTEQRPSYIRTYHPPPGWQIFEDFTLDTWVDYETGGNIGKYEFYPPDSIPWKLSWQQVTGIDPFFSATLQRGNELPPFDLIYEQGEEGERTYAAGWSEKYTLSLHSEGMWGIMIWIYR